MSNTIDNKVVEMRFDNKHFENNVRTSLSTLEKLKQSLNLSGASKGLENVNAAAKRFDISPLSNGVETVRAKFSAMEVMAVTALANITNSTVNAGKRIVKAMTIEPVMTGFSEYETKINAIQTIMSNTASKGTTMEDVTRVLNELNTYADKTIYNFAEMTKNIGTFTAAGVGLEESAAAIQGISNLAAASGSTSQQAATAMYQLSQALSTGTVKLMDWNSVVNAGMGGEKFQEALKATAREYGVAVDSIIEKNGSFRESLHEGWLTADILNTTLQKFTVEGAKDYAESMVASGKYTREQADALIKEAEAMNDAATKVKTFTQLWDTMKESVQSGWAQTWELIVGDFEEAREFLSNISDMFGKVIEMFSNARNTLLGGALNSKWSQLTEKIEAAGLSTETFHEKIKAIAKEKGLDGTKYGVSIDKLIEKHGSLAKAIEAGEVPMNIVKQALKELVGAEETATKSTKELGDVVDRVINGEFGTGQERWDALTKAGYDWAEVQNAVNEKLGVTKRHVSALTDEQKKNADQLVKLSDEQLKNKGYTEEQIDALRELQKAAEGTGSSIDELLNGLDQPSGRTLLLDSIHNILMAIGDVCKTIGAAWRDAFDPITSEQVYDAIKAFHDFTEKLRMSEETSLKLTSVFKGLFAILDIIATITGGALKIAFKIICEVFNLTADDALTVAANVGEAIAGFRDWLFEASAFAKGIDGVITVIKSVINVVRAWVEAFLKIPEVQQAIDKVKNSVSTAFSNIRDYFAEGIARIQEFIQRIKTMDSISVEDLGRIFKDFKDNVIDYFFDIDGAVEKIQNGIIFFKDKVKECFKAALNGFSSFRDKAEEFLGKVGDRLGWLKDKLIDFANFIKDKIPAAIAIGMGVFLIKALSKIGSALELLTNPLEGVGEVLDNLAGLIKAKIWETRANILLKFAGAIGILTVCLIALTQINQDNLWSAVGAIVALMGALTLFTVAIALIDKLGSSAKGFTDLFKGLFDNTGTTMLAMAGSLLLLAMCLKTLDKLDTNNILRNLGILTALAVGLGVMAVAISKVGGISLSGALGLLAVVFALKQMISALMDVGQVNIDRPLKTITTLLGLIGMIALLSKASKGISLKGALGVVGIILSLKLLVNVMDDIAEVDVGKLKGNLFSFVVLFGVLAALMIATRFAGENAGKASAFIIATSASLLLIGVAIKYLGELDVGTVERGVLVIEKVLLLFATLVLASLFAGTYAVKAGVMLLMAAGAILVLTGVMYLLQDLPDADLSRGMSVILALGLMFGVLIGLSGLAKGGLGTIIVLTIAVAALAAVVAAFTLLDQTALTNATMCLTMLIGVFALLVAVTGLVSSKDWLTDIAMLLGLTLVVGLLAGILGLLAGLNVEPSIESAASLSLVLIALAGACMMLDHVHGVSTSAIGAVGILALVILELGIIFALLDGFGFSVTLEQAAALSLLLVALSGVCLILSAVGGVAGAAIVGALAFAGVVAVIAGLLYELGKCVETTAGAEEFLDKGIVVLEKIGLGLGRFIGNIIGGIADGVISVMPSIGRNLAAFMNAFSSIDSAAVDGAKAVAETLLVLTGASILNGISMLFGGGVSMTAFAEQLVPFGEGIAGFSEAVSGKIDTVAVKAAAEAGLALAKMASEIPNAGGLLAALVGDNNMAQWGRELSAFGTCLVQFSETIAPGGTCAINAEAVEAASNAGKLMAEMANSIPNSGPSVASFFMGDNKMDQWGRELVAFGTCLVQFSETIAPGGECLINEEAVRAAANAGKLMTEMAGTIPNSGPSVVSFFVGENNMAQFGRELYSFGQSLVDFSQLVSADGAINEEAIGAAARVGTLLTTLADTIPNSGPSVVKFFVGDNDFATFGTQLVAFGTSLVDFCEITKGVNSSKVYAAVSAARMITDLANALPDEDGLGALFSGGAEEIDDFGKKLVKFGECLADYSTSVSGLNTTAMSSATTEAARIVNMARGMSGVDFAGITSFSDAIGDLGNAAVDEFIAAFTNASTRASEAGSAMLSSVKKGITDNSAGFKTAGTDIMDKLVEGIKANTVKSTLTSFMQDLVTILKNNYSKFKTAGTKLMDNLKAGINDAKSKVTEAMSKTASNSLEKVKAKRGSFYDAGSYLVQGFASGISANTWRAEAQAAAMAQAALDAAKEALDEHSPSKEAYRIGDFFGEGFVNAIGDYKSSAFDVSYAMADSAKTGLSKAIAKVKDIIDMDIDSQPTIRPVLDLSAVESGVGAMSGMFGINPSIGAIANVRSINSMMSSGQNGGNDDVISAIKDLGNKISESSGDSYSVNGITYDDGSNISTAVKSLVRAARVERRR